MLGWIKLYRDLLYKPIWQCSKPEQKSVLITLLMMANHEQKEWLWKGQRYVCVPGQFITSLESIAKKSGVSIQSVRTSLKNFQEKYDFLTSESTNQSRLITITNWALYQSEQNELTDEATSDQQATNKRPTTNKNVKNDKNEKKNIYISVQHLSITQEEYDKLVAEYDQSSVDNKIDYARNYAKLKNYKSLYLTLNNWLKSDKAHNTEPVQKKSAYEHAKEEADRRLKEEGII